MNDIERIYRVIDSTLRGGEYLSESLSAQLFDNGASAFVTAASYGVFDNLIQIDYIISKLAAKPPKPAVQNLLRLGVYLVRFSHTPAHAAVNGVVQLCRDIGKSAVSGFVNVVLRKSADFKLELPEDRLEALSVKHSYPLWALKLLAEQYGIETAEAIAAFKPEAFEPIRINTKKISIEDFERLLAESGIRYEYTHAKNVLRADYAALLKQKWQPGLFVKQNLGSVLIGTMIGGNPGSILDACAAPGGKAALLAQRFPDARVTACDIHAHRVKLIEKYCAGLDVNVSALQSDATRFNPDWQEKFDAVLLDVPCSGLGIASQRPDIKFFRKENDVQSLSELQRKILSNCSRYVSVGGQLVYATCTLFKQENQYVVEDFLKTHTDFKLVPADVSEIFRSGDCLQMLPHNHSGEGYFAAKLVRK